MKKRVLSKIVMVGTAVLLLAAMMVSTLLGTTSAMYEKSLSQKLDIKATPDLALRYYGYCGKRGNFTNVYQNSENISQTFYFSGSNGGGLRYQIAIPVAEEGYYSLGFNYDMVQNQDPTIDFATRDLNCAVGCQIVSQCTCANVVNDSNTPACPHNEVKFTYRYPAWRISADDATHKNGTRIQYTTKRLFSADDNYMWKTVAPARAEKVNLTFYASSTDVDNGYVIWTWDFNGLPAARLAKNGTDSEGTAFSRYDLSLTNISYDKIVKPEDDGAPYIDFTKMKYKNMAILPIKDSSIPYNKKFSHLTPTRHSNTAVLGCNTAGYTRSTVGRGTYVTNATLGSMTMQAEPLYFGVNASNSPWVDTDLTGTSYADNYDYSNPISLMIPIANVKPNVKYQVSFDISIAKQGILSIREKGTTANSSNFMNYSPHFNGWDIDKNNNGVIDTGANDTDTHNGYFFSNKTVRPLNLQSYLHDGIVESFNTDQHSTERMQLQMEHRNLDTHEVTKFGDITNAAKMDLRRTTTNNINKYYCTGTEKDGSDKSNINWLNAYTNVSHYSMSSAWSSTDSTFTDVNRDQTNHEYNGQNAIPWLTFKNASFSFKVTGKNGSSYKNDTFDDTFYWAWSLDCLDPSAWYRIKIDNVRITETVAYGSNIGEPEFSTATNKHSTVGVKIGNTTITSADYNANGLFRGSHGTGQNYAHRKAMENFSMPATNLYGPVYNMAGSDINTAAKFNVYLSGYCVVDGGVDRYVWSIDNGKTWHDMKYSEDGGPITADDNVLKEAAQKINPCVKLRTVGSNAKTFITFDKFDDGVNADFRGYKIYADLSEYAHISSLDVIFAAVPRNNPNARCEIFKIENFNETQPYYSEVEKVISDISTNGVVLSTDKSNLTINSGVAVTPIPHDENLGAQDERDRNITYQAFKALSGVGVYNYYKQRSLPIDYGNLMTLFSDIPVKKTLTVSGLIALAGGVSEYYYSVDGGNTWIDCDPNNERTKVDIKTSNAGGVTSFWTENVKQYLTNNNNMENTYIGEGTNTRFNTAATQLKIDLSAYAGQVVDIIVAAQPNNRFSYSPIARIDNVAVYGDGSTDNPNDRGTFFTRVNKIIVDGATVNSGNFTAKYSDGTTLTYLDKWNLGTNLGYGASGGYLTGGLVYTPFEVCNTDIFHVRKAIQDPVAVSSGGNIKISGFTFCPNGVNRYRYTLDGGITWEYIDGALISDYYAAGETNSSALTRAQRVDSSFTAADGAHGNYVDDGNYYETAWTPLTINLPSTLAQGEVRDLLVVAESNNASSEPSGKLYPVFHQTIRIAGGDELLEDSYVKDGSNVTLKTTVANLQSESYTLNYSAIPEIPMTKGIGMYYKNFSQYAKSSISVPKTYFFTDETTIPVTWTTSGSTGNNPPWLAISHASNEAFYIKWWGLAHNSTATVNVKLGGTESGYYGYEDPYVDLPAGEYKLWILADCKWTDRYDNMMVEPITIKIIDRNNPDLSYTHGVTTEKSNPHAKEVGTFKVNKTVFKQGEWIHFDTTGPTTGAWAAILGQDWTDYRLGYWSWADDTHDDKKHDISTADLAPGQYRLFYVRGSSISNAVASDTVDAIIDITILPPDASQTLKVNYTDSAGNAAVKTYEPDVGGVINVTDEVINVTTGTPIMMTAEYNNFGNIAAVDRFKFSFVPNT